MDDKEKLYNLMIKKSKESFLLAIELFNKPTISLNVECFCIFICNAWDLLLKAYLIKQDKSIYYKNNNRTYDLSKLIQLIFTNINDPLRKNLEAILIIRNKAVHLIISEYISVYQPLFLACIKNYTEKLSEFLKESINDLLEHTFLSLIIPTNNNAYNIIGRYPKVISDDFENTLNFLNDYYKNITSNGIINEKYALNYVVTYMKAKNKNDANISLNANEKIIVKEQIDKTISHPLSTKKIINKVNEQLEFLGIKFTPCTSNQNSKFTSYTFNLYVNYKKIKENDDYCYKYKIDNNINFSYFELLVDMIINDIKNDKDIFVKIKNKKDQPQEVENSKHKNKT